MPSPFPGMDPYLERHWLGVHNALVTYAADALNRTLPTDLVARIESRLVVESDGIAQTYIPDVALAERETRRSEPAGPPAGAAVAQPIIIDIEPVNHAYVVIMEPVGETIVTVIEFLSPSNKRGSTMHEYLEKRADLLSAGVTLVEVDLVREGNWIALIKPNVPPKRLMTLYRVVTRRGATPSRAELFPITLQQRLPIIPIPLRENDVDVPLDLQQLVDQVYDNGRHGGTDYRQPLGPPLEGDDAAWADELLKAAGRR